MNGLQNYMYTNCQFSNKNSYHNEATICENSGLGYSQFKKQERTGVASSKFTEDVIQELTLKNKVLTAQLSEYRILVASLKERLCQMEQRDNELTSSIQYFVEKEPVKLRTIQQEFSTMSELTNISGRKVPELDGDYFLHSLSTLLGSYSIQVQQQSWESYIIAMRNALHERKTALSFIKKIQQMRQQIEPGEQTITNLWKWLKKIGANYHCLIQYQQSKTQRPFTRK